MQGEAIVVACADPSHELRGLLQRRYGPRVNLVITLKDDITSAVAHLFREKLSHDASYRLDERAPEYSARVVVTRRQQIVAAIFGAAVVAGSIAGPALTAALLFLLLSLCYAANIALRAVLFAASGFGAGYRVSQVQLAALSDDTLPVYTILAPMYDEANMVPKLVAAIKKIDYPATALDVKIVLEEEDAKTIEAAQKLELDSRFEILIVPKASLQTKPRACNYALRFARGEYLVIYDAEDQPEPDQLKKAVAAFRGHPSDVVCFQARLNVYNADENFLTAGLMAQTVEGYSPDARQGIR